METFRNEQNTSSTSGFGVSKRNHMRHNRTASDIQSTSTEAQDHESNGLKAVNTVTGALQSLLKWSTNPLIGNQKARSFDSLHTGISGSQESLNGLNRQDSIKKKKDKRRSSTNMSAKFTPVQQHDNSKDSSPDMNARNNSSDTPSRFSFSKRDSNTSVSFYMAEENHDGEEGEEGCFNDDVGMSAGGATGGQVTPSRKSTDSSESVRGSQEINVDLREKTFEKSLNNILDKCIETSDLNPDTKCDETKCSKGERKKKSSPWYTMLSPTYKSRSEEFKRQFKDIPQDERLIVDYSCALQREILVHGRMFVTQNWICFYANIFRWETVVTIPTKEICAITKEKTARVIPNAIQITTEKDKWFFTSLTARDKTFMMLFRLWQNCLMEQPLVPQELWHWVHSSYGDELGLTSSDDDYVSPPSLSETKDPEQIINAMNKGGSTDLQASGLVIPDDGDSTQADISLTDSVSMPTADNNNDMKDDPTDFSDDTEEEDVSEGEVVCSGHDHFTRLAHNEVYQMSVDKLFELIFTDNEFFRKFTEARKLQDVTMTQWRDNPDDENIGRVRELTFTIPLNAPFGPKTSHTEEKHSCYRQSQPGMIYVINADCTPMGIPYADTFYVVNRYCLTRVNKESCRLRVTSEVKYRKSCWGVVRSMIERNCIQGVLDYFQCLGIHLRRESDQQAAVVSKPVPKRKLRKRRAIRAVSTPNDLPPPVRMTRTHTGDNMAVPPTPVRNSIPSHKDEKLKMNADTLVRIVCFILVLLVMFNALLFYKLWSLEMVTDVLYNPRSEHTTQNIFLNNPPKSPDEWMNLMQQQQRLHDAEMNKWHELIGASITLVDEMKKALVGLQEHIENRHVNKPP